VVVGLGDVEVVGLQVGIVEGVSLIENDGRSGAENGVIG